MTAEQKSELESLLLEDEEARQMYIDYMDVHLAMIEKSKMSTVESPPHPSGRPQLQSRIDSLFSDTAPLISAIPISATPTTKPTVFGVPISPIAWVPILSLLLAVGVVIGAAIGTSSFWSSLQVAGITNTTNGRATNEGTLIKNGAVDATANDPLYVAQVVRVTSDVTWSNKSAKPDFLLRARRGDRLDIVSGLVELEYYSGAKMILRGPCTYVLTGAKSGRLESGQITGDVKGGDFFITTPTARVMDLGTEFGVSVSDFHLTDVCVFDGEVQVVSEFSGASTDQTSASMSLTEGMSVRVQRDGKIDRAPVVDTQQFTRKFPDSLSSQVDQLSLVDLFSAASKDRFRLAGVIAPDTGLADQSPWLKDRGPGHRSSVEYLATGWHPYVDGVFIPDPSGVETQVDTSGNRVNLPESMGRTWGPVWSRRKFSGDKAFSGLGGYEDFWGTSTLEFVVDRLNRCQTGMIGIHSSVGVTFDLAAVRKEFVGVPKQLRLIVSNLDNSAVKSPEWSALHRFSADFFVFVDGKPKARRLDFQKADGEMEINVPLDQGDRFLSFASSDAMGRDGFDHVVIIDPVLLLE